MNYDDKYLKILLILLFGVMNIGVIALLIIALDFKLLNRREIIDVVIAALITTLINYAALQVFADD